MNPRLPAVSLFLAILLATTSVPADEQASDGFQPLFNGRDLAGWVPVNTAPSTWTVQDEMLICSGKPIGEIRTERMYQNFVLELEWRHLVPKGNAGVFIWADDITARGQPFHRGIEVQVLENAYGNTDHYTTHGDIFPIHGATMTPINGRGGSRAFPTEMHSNPSPQWNHYRITCRDGAISLAVNGHEVTRGKDCSPRKGYICLESEGGIVHYRNVRIQTLPDTPLAAEHVAVADRGYRCLYNGLDLTGWDVVGEARDHWQPRDWTLGHVGQSNGGDCALTGTEVLGDFGFIFDVRLRADTKTAQVQLRGCDDAALTIQPAAAEIAAHLEKTGRWNRFEGTLRGDRLSLSVNGKAVCENRVLKDIPGTGPLRIIADGPVDWANIYVRKLTR